MGGISKISKTFTIEKETLDIIVNNKIGKKISSDSASLERIVLEWSVLKNSTNQINIDEIVTLVLKELDLNRDKMDEYNELDSSRKDSFDNMPEE